MNVTSEFAQSSLDEIKALLDGGTLTIYSVARPVSADHAVDRSAVLATFTFASPAFGPSADGFEAPAFVANPVTANSVGTPGFARARKADGTTVADFSVGPGPREIKLAEVSCSPGAPTRVVSLKVDTDGGWPERPDYYDAHPRPGYSMPKVF
ncbi:hypothetical protein [Xanthobacter pseudotagetidis]|uniref:hypothetical protein n=1 Tax=Xanthobacter pseudotagetidis TaxID=3119911 RepID=UPI003727C7EA